MARFMAMSSSRMACASAISFCLIIGIGSVFSASRRRFIRSMAQKRLTAVGRVAARWLPIAQTALVWAIGNHLAATRPTAVNLFWAIDRMKRRLDALKTEPIPMIKQKLIAEAQAILDEDIAMNRAIGKHGAAVIGDGQTILTHCNAGSLATGGYGTALGVVRAAWEAGKKIRVVAGETRPVLQGSRLTVWELMQDGIPVTLITDNMAGTLMRRGEIQVCVVGADRITANGDVANKIGTYSLAVLANEHGIPFYVAAKLNGRPFVRPPRFCIVRRMVERTLAIIKPDAVSRHLVGTIIQRYEKAGLIPVAMKMVRLTKAQAEAFYYVHKQRPFFDSL